MSKSRHDDRSLVLASLVALFMAIPLAAGLQVPPPDESPPSAIEQALIDHACGPQIGDVRQACLRGQLLSLRTNFGRDLRRLSAVERKTLDSACSAASEALGRDAYVACLSGQLAALSRRRNRGAPAPPSTAAAPPPAPSAAAPANPETPAQTASPSSGVWIGAAVVTALAAAAAGAFLFLKGRRRAQAKCRNCGGAVEGPGDLCQKCRRDAADALRRASTERADQQRAHEDERRRQREQEEEQQREKARQAAEDEARRRQQEEARQREEAERQRREQARQQSQAAAASEDAFDSYAVLGVARDASPEAIRAAYEEARAKYGPDQVEFLSTELQAHYKTKAEAVERAYRTLTGTSERR